MTAIIFHLTTGIFATNTTEEAPTNKTKRTVSGQVHNYGENRPVVLYPESTPVSPQSLASLYAPVTLKPVFDPELSKQVAAQQVLYEFQQTPTNAVSNVHVNQFYQPLQSKDGGPAQFSGSETVATPVQHSALVRHGQNFAQVQYHPLPQHVQTHQYIPGKLLYVNGKITYPSGQQNGFQQHQAFQQQHQQQQNGFQPQQNGFQPQQRPSFLYTHPQAGTHKFVPPPLVTRNAYRRFQAPEPQQILPITKPMSVPAVNEDQKEEPEVEEEENAPNKEEEEEENEENDEESYEEDDEDDRYFNKYGFDDDDHNNYREDDEEDNERGSSKPVPKKHKKVTKPNKYNKSDGYKYSESYSTSSKYEKPMRKGKKIMKNPKVQVKTVKGSKGDHPRFRNEKIEGKQSRNIPVVHKQKIFKEKWYVTKSTDDSML